MKKIIAINSPLFEEKNVTNYEDYLPPLGLGIIVTSLSDYDIEFLDSIADNLSLQEIIVKINRIKPELVLINIFTTNFLLVRKIVEETSINTHWVIGGLSTKSLRLEIFKWKTNSKIDVIYGDGELIVPDIVNSSLREYPTEIENNKRYFSVDRKSKYHVHDISHEKLNRNIFRNEPQTNVYGEPEICIYTSRGCPYNCAYCVAARSRNMELGVIRYKSTNKIISELTEIETNFLEVTAIRVLDDLFLSNKRSFNDANQIFSKFCFNWRAMCHIKSITVIEDVVLEDLKDSGCKELFIGIESGSPRILKRIHKTDHPETILQSVERLLKTGINVKAYFICGFPNETVDDIKLTFELAQMLKEIAKQHSGNFRNSTFQFRPYFGTELYDELIAVNGTSKDAVLYQVKASDRINDNVRDKSFNFDSGNYSLLSVAELHEYIQKMNALNDEPA